MSEESNDTIDEACNTVQFEKERKEKKRISVYGYTDTDTEKRITIYLTKDKKFDIYIPDKDLPTIKKLREILKREGKSLSEWVRQNIEQYVRLHEPGNPQQRLDTIIINGKPYCALVCQRCNQPAKSLTEAVFRSGLTLRECDSCFNHAREHGLVRKVLKRVV